MQRKKLTQGRVFPLDELDGFYVGEGLCVHVTFEDETTIVIDVFDNEAAAFDSSQGDIIGTPVILNVRTGEAKLE